MHITVFKCWKLVSLHFTYHYYISGRSFIFVRPLLVNGMIRYKLWLINIVTEWLQIEPVISEQFPVIPSYNTIIYHFTNQLRVWGLWNLFFRFGSRWVRKWIHRERIRTTGICQVQCWVTDSLHFTRAGSSPSSTSHIYRWDWHFPIGDMSNGEQIF